MVPEGADDADSWVAYPVAVRPSPRPIGVLPQRSTTRSVPTAQQSDTYARNAGDLRAVRRWAFGLTRSRTDPRQTILSNRSRRSRSRRAAASGSARTASKRARLATPRLAFDDTDAIIALGAEGLHVQIATNDATTSLASFQASIAGIVGKGKAAAGNPVTISTHPAPRCVQREHHESHLHKGREHLAPSVGAVP